MIGEGWGGWRDDGRWGPNTEPQGHSLRSSPVSSKDNYGLMPLLATSESVKGFTEKWGSDDIFYLTKVIRLYVPHLSKV
jgi:hypothetical protein